MPSVEERFWSKVDKSETCWIWTGCRTKAQYGMLSINRRPVYSHRVSWEMHNGPIPDGKFVLHHCDVPPCVRPDHLFVGTNAENMRDMISKGRAKHPPMFGSRIGTSKLTEEQVREIRAKYRTMKMLAAEYGVSEGTINFILKNQTWRHA